MTKLRTTTSTRGFKGDTQARLYFYTENVTLIAHVLPSYGTSYLDAVFKKSFDDNDWNIGIYMGTASGEFRKFPGGVHKKDYDPVVRPWFANTFVPFIAQ